MKIGEYVYCIIKKENMPKDFSIKGIDNSSISCAPYMDLAAVLSKTELKDYEPNEENVTKHKQVSLHVLQDTTVLPVAFGMVFKSRGVLITTMRKVYGTLKRNLRLTDNKVELGVKALFNEEMNEAEKEEFKKTCEKDFIETLNKIAVGSKQGKLFSERLAFNISFLVDRDKIEEFSKAIEKLINKYKSLKVQYTGPWPPYNFVDIKIMAKGRG
ncbi:MAG: GvpL/GvpF family gas vesicle protein [archaeon]